MINATLEFLGHPVKYWLNLQAEFEKRNDYPETRRLFDEVIILRGKVSFYESRISEMSKLINKGD